MVVRCISESLTRSEQESIGASRNLGFKYHLIQSKTYCVLGVTFVLKSSAFGATVLFQILDESGHLMPIPASMFEVVDDQVSAQWRGRFQPDGAFALWPLLFFEEYFHERLLDQEPKIVEKFRLLVDSVQNESQPYLERQGK